MELEPVGVARYRRCKALSGLNPASREFVAAQYQKAQAALDEFDHRYRLMLHRYAPCRLYPRQRLANFGRHVYGLKRRLAGERLLEQVARDAVKWVSDGTGVSLLARAARLALDVAGGTGSDADEQWIQVRIESLRIEQQQSGGNVNEELKTVSEAAPTADEKLAAARAREEKVVVKVRLSELRQRVESYLAERLNSKEAAELAAQELVEAFEAGERRSTPKPEKPGDSRRAGEDWSTDDSVVTRFRSKRTVQGLKQALAGHQPIVRLVVAERLQGQRSIDEIATKLDLSREEVLDILAKMRFWVGRFTDSYREDWYWSDSDKRYVIPEHVLAPKLKKLRSRRN